MIASAGAAARRALLAAWGYRVTTAGGWIVAAGHGAVHRWRGWSRVALPAAPTWTAGFDGAAEPTNPGPAAYGAWLATPLGDLAWSAAEAIGWASNNVAEWRGLLAVLEAARAFHATPLHVIGDSALVVHQFTGAYAVRAPHLQPLVTQARRLAQPLTVTVTWVPRAANARADTLSRQALAAATPPPVALDALPDGRFIAHGRADYLVDPARGTCTCPAFRYRRGPCKHLRAAHTVLGTPRAGG